jgi:predicted dienelactone hydrolase
VNADITCCHAHQYVFLICLVSFSVITRAAGVREILIPPDLNGPQISARLWTPCAVAPKPITVDRGSTQLTIKAVKDCAPLGQGLPLILVSHGLFGDVFDHHDTAEFLANSGFAVVTLDHTMDSLATIKDNSQDDIASFLVRTVDVSRVLDFLLSSSQPVVDIDPQRIGFFGWSRGGYTGLVLAGAVPNFHYPLAIPCPDNLLMCRQIRDGNIPKQGPGYEPRIKAFVIADPVNLFPDRASLQKVVAPIQLWSSERGGMGVRPDDVVLLEKNLPHAPEFHRPANSGHFAFFFPCSKELAKTDPLECDDPTGFDRAAFHRTFNAQVLEFFRKKLLRPER